MVAARTGRSKLRTIMACEPLSLAPVAAPGSLLAPKRLAAMYCSSLHADSRLPPGALERINEALSTDENVIGGNFRVVFDGDTAFSRRLTGFCAWIRLLGFYYGDSGIFVRRPVYEAIGGFRSMPVMEDWDFVRRLERFGRTCCIKNPPLVTSSRRFEGRRPLEILCGLVTIHALFWLGVSPDRLVEVYRSQVPPRQIREPRV